MTLFDSFAGGDNESSWLIGITGNEGRERFNLFGHGGEIPPNKPLKLTSYPDVYCSLLTSISLSFSLTHK